MMQQTDENRRFLQAIYHEQQSGALCAVHAVNSCLQKRMWNEFQFADIAKGLDEQEHSVLDKEERGNESVNYDDSGYFSIQVVVRSLEISGISCSHLMKKENEATQKNPLKETAFICNLAKHWFTIRKFGTGFGARWFNLNSTFKYPEFVTDTFLSLFLKQLTTEGYSVFVCRGRFPDCDADRYVKLFNPRAYISPRDKLLKKKVDFTGMNPTEADQLKRALEMSKNTGQGSSGSGGQHFGGGGGFDSDLQKVLEMSRREAFGGGGGGGGGGLISEEEQMRRAIELSMMDTTPDDPVEESQGNVNVPNVPVLPPMPSMEDEEDKMEDEQGPTEEEKKERMMGLMQKFDPKNEPKGVGVVRIKFRNFDAKTFMFSFPPIATITDLYDFVEVYNIQKVDQNTTTEFVRKNLVICNNFPKKEFEFEKFKNRTLDEEGLKGSVMLAVMKK